MREEGCGMRKNRPVLSSQCPVRRKTIKQVFRAHFSSPAGLWKSRRDVLSVALHWPMIFQLRRSGLFCYECITCGLRFRSWPYALLLTESNSRDERVKYEQRPSLGSRLTSDECGSAQQSYGIRSNRCSQRSALAGAMYSLQAMYRQRRPNGSTMATSLSEAFHDQA